MTTLDYSMLMLSFFCLRTWRAMEAYDQSHRVAQARYDAAHAAARHVWHGAVEP